MLDLSTVEGREQAVQHAGEADVLVTIYGEIGVDSGALYPEFWKLVEW